MKPGLLNRRIDAAPLLEWLDRNAQNLCAAVVLLFFCSPLVEMIICLFNRTERICPLTYYPLLINRVVHPASVALGAGALAGLLHRARGEKISLWRAMTRNRLYLYFLGMALWMLLASLVNHKSILFDLGDMYRNEPLPLVLSYILVFLFCATFVGKDQKEPLVLVSVAVSIALGVYSSVRYVLVQQGVAHSISPYSVAVFFQHNHYGYYLAVHIMLCSGLFALSDRRWARGLALVGLVANTAVLSTNNTFGAWLACVIAFVFQLIVLRIVKRRLDRRSLAALAVFMLVTFIMGFWTNNIFSSLTQFFRDVDSVVRDPRHSDSAGTTRWKLWKFTVGKIGERPVFGFGNEGIDAMLQEATGSTRPHNELLQYAAFYGIPAALLYVAGVLCAYLRGYSRRASLDGGTLICLIGAFGYLASSMFGNTMFYTAPFLFLLLGMGYNRE